MAIYLYLLTSYLLSGVVYLGYHLWYKRQATALQQRWYLRIGVALSLVLPLWSVWPTTPAEPYPAHIIENLSDDFVNDPILDQALMACYERVNTQEGFCHCEQLQQANLLYYHPNPYYDFAIQHRAQVRALALAVSGLLIAALLGKLLYLLYLIRTSRQSVHYIDGQRYIYLHRDGRHLAASFKLWNRYIIWHSALDALPLAEQNAVLAHEVAHIKGGDTLESITLSILQIGWWLNPVFYALQRDLTLINEHLADQWAIYRSQAPQQYAHLLLRLQALQQRNWVAGIASGNLRKRITAIVQPEYRPWNGWTPFVSLVIGGLLLSITHLSAPTTQAFCFEYERYQLMHDQHQVDGKSVFCKSCLYQDLMEARASAGAQWRRLIPIDPH